MQSKKNWMAGFLIAMLIVGSGWLVSNAPAAIDSTAKLIADLRTDLTKAKSGSVNYTNDVSGVILIRENLILPASINYANDVSGVILTAYRLADDVVRAGAINYSNDVSAVIVAAYGIADGLILAGAVNYSNDVSAVIVAAYGIADGLILAGAENYTNDATATVRTYAESLTGEVKPARFVKAVDDRGAIWKLSVHHNGAITATIVP